MMLAQPVERAIADTHSPMANMAAMLSTSAKVNPPGALGAPRPNPAVPATTRMPSATAARTRLMMTCAASIQAGGTGVVDIRRKMPCSR